MASLKNTTINETGYLRLPSGTTAQRPGSPVDGMTRYNSQFKLIEFYADGAWKYMHPIIEDGLILSLDAAEPASYPGSGTTWTDLSSNAYTGTLQNGAAYSSSNGGAINFDGSDDRVVLSNDLMSDLSVPAAGNDIDVPYSMECVFKLDTSPTGGGLSGASLMGHASAGGIGLQVFYNSTLGINHINFGFRSNNNNSFLDDPISLSTWYHVVCTRGTGGTSAPIKFYLNGSLRTSTTGNLRIDYTTNEFQVGDAETRIGNADGLIAIGRVYNRVISDSEVAQNFSAIRGRYGL